MKKKKKQRQTAIVPVIKGTNGTIELNKSTTSNENILLFCFMAKTNQKQWQSARSREEKNAEKFHFVCERETK